jgi:chaperone required for assembly of F1-ATPase
MIRRFYREVTVQVANGQPAGGGWQVMLDGRRVKTVAGAPQIVPTQSLAEALAAEWARQGEKIDPSDLPLRDMADFAIDIAAPGKAALAQELVAYGDTDTLCYRADPDEPLHVRQLEVWEPLLRDFEQRHGVQMVRVSGIVHRPQDKSALAALEARMGQENPFALTGLDMMTKLAASLTTGLLALDEDNESRARQLWQAACLEEEWQADLWGREYEAEQRRARREADFLRAWRFSRLARA